MRLPSPVWWVGGLALLLSAGVAAGQGFTDLNFQQGTIVLDHSSPYYPYVAYTSDAVPGWTTTGDLAPNDILYNDIALGDPAVSIIDKNYGYPPGSSPPLDGNNYGVILYGGAPPGAPEGVSISQTALVPVTANSILFEANNEGGSLGGVLTLSLGGQNIPFYPLSTGSDYTLYGGDVSGFAGKDEQLIFTALEGGNNYWELDDIQFSSQAIPEPGVFGLTALGAALLGWRVLRRGR